MGTPSAVLLREVQTEITKTLGDRVTCIGDGSVMTVKGISEEGQPSEIKIEYVPGEGFGMELVGWEKDADRTYRTENVVKKALFWLGGNLAPVDFSL
jgi:hypothetical protein